MRKEIEIVIIIASIIMMLTPTLFIQRHYGAKETINNYKETGETQNWFEMSIIQIIIAITGLTMLMYMVCKNKKDDKIDKTA